MKKNDFKIFYSLVLCIILLGLATALKNVHITFLTAPLQKSVTDDSKSTTTPQFVLISFDGARSVDTWKELRLLRDEESAKGVKLNYTFFMNAAYLLTPETKYLYHGPGKEVGKSNIGFSEDLAHLRIRINEMNLAIAAGDEIAPHTVGHFSGGLWSKEEWKEELTYFNQIMFGLDTMYSEYPDANLPKLNLSKKDIIGFRAPYLDKSPGLFEALHEMHFRYDSSEVGTGNAWPIKDAEGMWRIPLGTIHLGPDKTPSLAMDYNIYMHDSQAKNLIKKGTPEWKTAYDETLAGFLGYFNQNYSGNRAPVLVGYHFSTQWNDGVYWEVMKNFVREVCGKPDVRCGTFRDLVDYLDLHGTPAPVQKALTASVGNIELSGSSDAVVEKEGGEEF